jgi:mannitol-1-phosphate 5-dehydrogenase
LKAVVIGPGRIGCGFAGQLLHDSGFDVVFVARNPVLVDHFNRVRHYRICLSEREEAKEVVVDGVRAVSAAHRGRVAAEIAEADVVATAVGANNLADVAPLIAAGLASRTASVNVLAFENLLHASRRLRDVVARYLPANLDSKHGFCGTVINRAVTQRLGDPALDEPLTFLGDSPATFQVDGANLCPPVPAIHGMIVTDHYEAWAQRKLYTYGAGHATAAYLGYLKGYHYIHTAIRDPEIRLAVLAAMAEGQRGLAARFGRRIAGDRKDLLEIIERFENGALRDRIVRVGRDPRRKLGTEERLVGAARLAQESGIRPEKLALATAAALCFSNPSDPSCEELQRTIQVFGVHAALKRVCGLDSARGLGRLVAESWSQLASGWHRENLLLSLERLMWTWTSESVSNGNGSLSHEPVSDETVLSARAPRAASA